MEFSINNNKIFLSIFDNIKQYSDIIKLKIDKKGIHIQSIDNAQICIIDIVINKNYFNSFNTDKTYNLDFDINDITKIFKVINNTRLITFSIYDECNLKIKTEPLDNNITKIFKINSICSNSEFININCLNIKYNFNIQSKQLLNIFTELNIFSDDINILINNNGLQFIINNDNIKSKYFIENIKTDEQIECYFLLKYLAKFKIISQFDNTNLKLDNEKPIILNINENDININFILSPKINL